MKRQEQDPKGPAPGKTLRVAPHSEAGRAATLFKALEVLLMTKSFKETYADLQNQQAELARRTRQARTDAIAYVQEMIELFEIKHTDLRFAPEEDDAAVKTAKGRRPTRPKYRLPNGVEWSGKGIMKKEFRLYLEENNLTREDLVQFLTEDFR